MIQSGPGRRVIDESVCEGDFQCGGSNSLSTLTLERNEDAKCAKKKKGVNRDRILDMMQIHTLTYWSITVTDSMKLD